MKYKLDNLPHNQWFKMDNAAKIYPCITSVKDPNIFRVSVTLKYPIKLDALKAAVTNVIRRFFYFRVYLKKGFFWNYFEITDDIPKLSCETKYPCRNIPIRKNRFLFRIIPFQNRIALESTHALTDGFGVLTFLKSIVGEYLNIAYGPFEDFGDLIRPDQPVNPEEYKDKFEDFYKITTRKPVFYSRAYHLKEKIIQRPAYIVVRGEIPLDRILEKSKEYKVSLNDFLVSSMLFAFQNYYINQDTEHRKTNAHPLRAVVPVNLRSLFPSKTMRNFSFIITPGIDPRLGYYSFEEILKIVHHYIRLYNNPKTFLPDLMRNIEAENNIFIRAIPLFIKDFILRTYYNAIGNSPVSTSVSNLGRVDLPQWMNGYIEYFDFIPSPSYSLKLNTGVISYGNTLSVCIGKLITGTDIERNFFTHLVKLGIPVKIETNWR